MNAPRTSTTTDASATHRTRAALWFGLPGVLLLAAAARIYAHTALGVRFDLSTLPRNLQFIDPELLRTRLLESVFYIREQPPLFNLFLGAVLKAAPERFGDVFTVAFLAGGMLLSVGLFALPLRLGTPIAACFLIAAAFTVHPATLLYENWLMYEYPLTAMLVLAALGLHAYLCTGRPVFGAAFFGMLAVIVLTRGTFHLVWIGLIVLAVLLLPGVRRKQALAVAAVPLLAAAGLYVKQAALYGDLICGDAYRKFNRMAMVWRQLTREQARELGRLGRISPAYQHDLYRTPVTTYQPYLPPMGETGIPVLDQVVKSGGAMNWHHHGLNAVVELYYQSALTIGRNQPKLYWISVRQNVRQYFLPADATMPFDAPGYTNTAALRGWPRAFNLLLAGQFQAGGVGWFIVFGVPALVLYGLSRLIRDVGTWRRSRASLDRAAVAEFAVIAFALFNVLYVSTSSVFLSYADHNRYRFCLMPLLLVLLGLAWRDGARRWRGRGAPPTHGSGGRLL